MIVTLNIDNRRIRLVSQHAGRVESWQTLDLPPGVIKNGLILDPPAVAALLKERFRTLKLSPQRVKVCLTGLDFIYRVLNLPNLKTLKLRSAVERATQKEVALPLDNLYLDWQVINETDRELEIFVMGIGRQMVDVLLTTLKLAGISLETMELKALALARSISHKNALVVDCEPDAFEILIVQGGVPVTIHRVSPKNEMSTLGDNLNQMMTELNRTIDYFNLNHPENSLTQATPVILTGSLCDDSAARNLIVQGIGHAVEYISSTLSLPANFPASTFAANLGLLNQSQKSKLSANVDLIKARRRTLSHPIPIRKMITSGVIAAALLLLALIWTARHQAAEQAADLQLRANNLNQELIMANQALKQANLITEQITAITSETQKLASERKELTGKGNLAVVFGALTQNLPSGSYFTQISSLPDKITVDGQAGSREDIVNYIHSLENGGLFAEVRIALIDTTGDASNTSNTFRIVIER